jgi:hypothetical protein
MWSCKDKDLPPATVPKSTLNVLNATADTIKYFINGTRQNNLSPIYVGGSTGYLAVPGGLQTYKFNKSNNGFPTLFTKPFTLDTSRFYSIFVCGETADKAFIIDDPFAAADSIIIPDTLGTKSAIRFVNASPDAGALDFVVNKGDTVNLKSVEFGKYSTFLSVNAGTKVVNVYDSATNTIRATVTLTFSPNQTYTFFTRGSFSGKGNAVFGLSVFSIGLSSN